MATAPVSVAATWAGIALEAEIFRGAPPRGAAVPLGMAGRGVAEPPGVVACAVLPVWEAVAGVVVGAAEACEAVAECEAAEGEGSQRSFLGNANKSNRTSAEGAHRILECFYGR